MRASAKQPGIGCRFVVSALISTVSAAIWMTLGTCRWDKEESRAVATDSQRVTVVSAVSEADDCSRHCSKLLSHLT